MQFQYCQKATACLIYYNMLDVARHNGFSVKSLIWMVWSLSNSYCHCDSYGQTGTGTVYKLTTHRSLMCCKLVDWLFLTFLYFKILMADFIEENVNPLPFSVFHSAYLVLNAFHYVMNSDFQLKYFIHQGLSTVCCLDVPPFFFSSVSVTIFALMHMLSENYAW